MDKKKTNSKSGYVKTKYDRIEVTCLKCKAYNQKYNENLSYGQFVMLMKLGKLKPVPVIE